LLALRALTIILVNTLVRGPACVNSVFLFWGWSRFIHLISPSSLIYHPHVLYAFERGLVGAPRRPLPFAYPPSMLLLIWPLALMPPVAALPLWLGVSLVLYLWACWHRPWGRWIAIAGLAAPSTLAALLCAQTSLMAAALMIGGCRLAGRRPILAGLLFGLLAAVKPQFGLLLPVALVWLKQWRSIAAAGATFGVTAAASIAAFGWAAWASFPTAMLDLSRLVARDAGFDSGSPTVIEGLRLLGFGQAQAEAGQLVAAVCTAIVIWVCCRRGPMALALAAVMVGAFLVTPYASAYDLPLASYGVLAIVIERHKSNVPLKPSNFSF
jgi:Glycosyltransferase family 87